MNLHGIVSAAIGTINPQVPITLQISTGSDLNAEGLRVPSYAAPVTVLGQVQALTQSDIIHADALNIQGLRRSVYLNGEVDGLVRVANKGGDLITLADGTVWLVCEVLEHWPDWTKCIIVLQDDTALPSVSTSPAPLPIVPPQPEVGFGQIRYAPVSGSPPIQMPANVRTLLTFPIDPTQTQDFLNAPFVGNISFDGTTIRPRHVDDAMDVLVNLLVTSFVIGGSVRFDIDVGSPLGPTGSTTSTLFNPPGAPERVTGILYVQTLSYFIANGAKIYITSTVPLTITSEAIVLIPLSTFAGA